MAAPNREEQLLSVGKQCSHQSCMLVDFLPFKCQHCESSFCQEHFMVSAHECPKYDETKYNRVAPNCPLCNAVVSVKPGQDANVAMESHFMKACSAMTGKAKAKSSPVCAKVRCGKTLFAPIRCTKCNEQFCPAHRFPADHACSPAAATQTRSSSPTAASRLLVLNSKASAAGAATVGAIKTMASSAQAGSSRPAAPKAAQAPKSGAQTPNMPNLFSKTDRRAKAERESRRKAMQERAKKGLLSEEEKLALATEEAERAREGDDKKECAIM
ncbi:hypothetical protein DFH07DRAFT_740035 [Mycena maculata]|uniref:AN1-type domain-containing protein n=1 Tax=Mycena maculata TaxID=230809 RepID=A0AAD7JBR0_9AGAR|nr:hypothetical protein DFH07DRAFT_740035 [Mycena maculata]